MLAYALAVGLLGLAVLFGWQQVRTLSGLGSSANAAPLERSYLRRQAWLRLTCCGIMVVLACLLAGTYGLGMEERIQELGRNVQAQRERGEAVQLTPEQLRLRQWYSAFWLGILTLVLLLVMLAALDVLAIQRFARARLRQLDNDRQASVAQQVAAYRSQRNGQH